MRFSQGFKMAKLESPGKPTTSWIIRTLNEEKWLGMVLEKLFAQSRLDFEVIIVDNESADKTLQIIKDRPIRRVLSIPRDKYNHSYALNLGINESWGEFAGIISGHSVPVSRTWYEDALKNFEDKKVAAVTGRCTALPDGAVSEKLGDLFSNTKRSEKEHYCKWMTNTNVIIRKALWKEYPFDEELDKCEDYDWASEMIARGYNIIKDPAFDVYHSHGGLGRPVYWQRIPGWKWTCALIDKRPRPRNSLTRVNIK